MLVRWTALSLFHSLSRLVDLLTHSSCSLCMHEITHLTMLTRTISSEIKQRASQLEMARPGGRRKKREITSTILIRTRKEWWLFRFPATNFSHQGRGRDEKGSFFIGSSPSDSPSSFSAVERALKSILKQPVIDCQTLPLSKKTFRSKKFSFLSCVQATPFILITLFKTRVARLVPVLERSQSFPPRLGSSSLVLSGSFNFSLAQRPKKSCAQKNLGNLSRFLRWSLKHLANEGATYSLGTFCRHTISRNHFPRIVFLGFSFL